MITVKHTDSNDPGFQHLVKLLDRYLAEMDGDEHAFYAQYNKSDSLKHAVVVYDQEKAIGCGAIKPFDAHTLELKRMYVLPETRNRGIAQKILNELESLARKLGFEKCILETGKKQTAAIALYRKCGYLQIPNYGQYAGAQNSLCFEKYVGTAPGSN